MKIRLFEPRTKTSDRRRFGELALDLSTGSRLFIGCLVGFLTATGGIAQGPTCGANPNLVTSCYVNGDPLPAASPAGMIDTLVQFDYNGTTKTTLATASQTGSQWGLAYDVVNDRLFSAAVLRRHVGLGPSGSQNGLGAIYVSSPPTAAPVLFHDLAAHVSVGTIPSNMARGLPTSITMENHDSDAFAKIGKAGLGDIEVTPDGATLFVTNLDQRRVYSVATASPGSAPTALPAFPDAMCVNGVARPWALKYHSGVLYAGLVCTAENPTGVAADLSAHVYSYDGTTWSPALSYSLSYPRQNAYPGFPAAWNPWRDTVADINPATPAGELFFSHPSPILSDLEILDDGSIVMGFVDRTAMQFGARNYGTDPGNTDTRYYIVSGGDILRASADGDGTFTLESNASVGSVGPTGGAGTSSGPGNGEFYFQDEFPAPGEEHRETSFGGLAFLEGAGEIVLSGMDPEAFDSGGIYWLSNTLGTKVRVQELYRGANNSGGFFGKAVGLGDVELLCGDAPATAPSVSATKVDSILVGGGDGQVDAGDTLRYTVVITNSGDGAGNGVTFTSSVDANTALVVGSVTTTQGTVTTGNTAGDTAVEVDIGALADSGGTATVTFDVIVTSPIPAGVTELACQGLVAGDNFADTPTDDPDDPMGGDPTNTPLNLGSDFGDAPDTYTTTASPSHQLDAVAGIFLGACVDSEADGQPNIGADGDDTNLDGTPMAVLGTCTGNDDEDGVTFDTMIMACSMAQVTVASTGTGAVLNGWIDFDHDGTFDHPGEQVFSDQALTGSDSLMFAVPCDTRSGGTYARFRVDSGGGLSPTGAAGDGEVEDYSVVTKGADFGDAPDSYGTVFAAGAYHTVDPGTPLYLGACVDTEANGQPVPAGDPSTGDDLVTGLSTQGTCTGNDDEDGVSFDTMIVACDMADVTVTASMAGVLNAWLDFGGDGMFDAGDQIFTDQALVAGPNTLSFAVPCNALSQTVTYARFRVASAGGLGSGGAAADGEVEDYDVATKGLDLGDAPDSYGTQDPATAASHVVAADTGLYLGTCVDTEAQGQPATAGNPATGDDTAMGLSTVGTCTGNDDEDGVGFDTMIVACGSADITVTANTAGALDAWLDFGGDGMFDAGDQIVTNQALSAGANNLSFNVPCDAPTQSVTYARFRLSTAGGLGATGQAMDGEVEDYEVVTKGLDLGDAPDSYATTLGSAGAAHAVDPSTPLYLGACVDTEADGQPVTAGNPADGDDVGTGLSTLGTCVANDDEDGVSFDSMIVACGTADVTVTSSAPGMLDAWLDFGGDGAFDAGDQIFPAVPLNAGANSLQFNVPCDTPTQAVTYARFRVSTVGALQPGGMSINGEVEDYEVITKGLDLGDAPDSFGTTVGTGGASHAVDPSTPLYLGTCVDTEADGQPVVAGNPADGDDNGAGLSDLGGCAGSDDEDGVIFEDMIVACGTSNVTVIASAAGLLDAWIDFNGDGTFGAGEQILSSQALAAGVNALPYSVPCDTASQAVTYSRFRVSSAGGLGATGAAMDGEVEDYEVVTKGLDLGDAPESEGYPTLIASDGARHVVLPVDNPTLGVLVDTESDGQPTAGHDGDDSNGVDDEDGVAFGGPFVPAGGGVDVTLTAGATGGLVSAWIDWNGDGDWDDAGEQVAVDVALAASASTVLSIAAPIDAVLGATCARVRISSAGGDGPTGLSMDGEIEDYVVEVASGVPAIGLAKELVEVQQVSQTEHSVLFSMTVENLGEVPLSNVQILADLATAFAEADDWQVDMLDSMDLTVNPSFDGDSDANILTGTDTLDIGETGIVLLQMIVSPGTNPGPYICSSEVTSEDPMGDPVTDISQNGDDSDTDDDGDAGDDNEPTPVVFTISVLDIPTLDWRGLLVMVLLLIGAAGWRLRRS